MRILVVEDEPEMAQLLVGRLTRAGFDTDHAASFVDAQAKLDANTYSLAVLDRRMADGDGVALIPHVRQSSPGVRVMMLTALDKVSDKIAGLDAGADDYLTKPFDVDELLARIRANLRRSGAAGVAPPVTVGALSFDTQTREAFVSGRPIVLHRRELAALESLLRRLRRRRITVQRARRAGVAPAQASPGRAGGHSNPSCARRGLYSGQGGGGLRPARAHRR